jgi:membrane associated rhomboid family serine protease
MDSVPSRSVPVVTRTLILINVVVFFFELALPQETLEQVFYLFGIVPARFAHPNWAARVGFPVNDYWPLLTHQFLHGGWVHIIGNMCCARCLCGGAVVLCGCNPTSTA